MKLNWKRYLNAWNKTMQSKILRKNEQKKPDKMSFSKKATLLIDQHSDSNTINDWARANYIQDEWKKKSSNKSTVIIIKKPICVQSMKKGRFHFIVVVILSSCWNSYYYMQKYEWIVKPPHTQKDCIPFPSHEIH